MKREIVPRIAELFYQSIRKLTRVELERTAKEAASLSTTNCWWVEWELKSAILEAVKSSLEYLPARKAKKR